MAYVAKPAMIGMQFIGVCPECRQKFEMTLGNERVVTEAWHEFYRAYGEHYDAVHVDSWQKLARDAVRQLAALLAAARQRSRPRISPRKAGEAVVNASTDMIGVTILGYCPTCTAKLSASMAPGGITPQTTYNLLELSYVEHCRTYHEDSWQKLARDAMKTLGHYANEDLRKRLATLEAKQ